MNIDARELLPQREPFVMVGSLVSFDMKTVETETVFSGDNVFAENGRVSAAGLIENIAQTCAARIGYINKFLLKKGVEVGYIGAVKDCKVYGLPEVGESVRTRVTVVEEIFGMILAEAEVKCCDRLLVSAEIKIAVASNEEK